MEETAKNQLPTATKLEPAAKHGPDRHAISRRMHGANVAPSLVTRGLVLTCSAGDGVVLLTGASEIITIRVVKTNTQIARLVFDAPQSVSILREKLLDSDADAEKGKA